MPPPAKTAIVEYIVFTGEQSHERESSGELLAPSVLADGAGRTKSYTRAAEKLGISKSAISQKISELERVTGKTLVHRTTRSVSLSDDGLRLVAELNEPFGQLRDIFTGACDEGGPLRGTLRLTAPVAFSRQQLVPAIAPFCISIPSCICSLRSPTGWSLWPAKGSISPSATVGARRSRIPTSPGRCVTPRRLPSRPQTIFAAMAARRPRRSAPPPMPDLSSWATAPAVDVRLPSVARCSGDHQRAGAIRHQ